MLMDAPARATETGGRNGDGTRAMWHNGTLWVRVDGKWYYKHWGRWYRWTARRNEELTREFRDEGLSLPGRPARPRSGDRSGRAAWRRG